MKLYKYFFIILIIFLKTGNVLSDNSLFNVNNVEIEKKTSLSNDQLADQAIKKGFSKLIERILLDQDIKKLNNLELKRVKQLVKYYQISDEIEDDGKIKKLSFSVSFDKRKIHDLFYNRGILHSEITNKEIFVLPILKKKNKIFIFNQNYFYSKWNEIYESELIEFILPLENIEIIQTINRNADELINLDLRDILEEYSGKNLALVLIEDNNQAQQKIYLKTNISNKNIIKKINLKNYNQDLEKFYEKIIIETKKEIINTIKSQNLIDVRVPSFLNAKFEINRNNNLVKLNSKLKNIDLVDNIYVQEFNKDYVFLKIKYLGKLDKIIKELKEKKIILELINDQWSLKLI